MWFKERRPALHKISNPIGTVCRGCFSNSIPYLFCLIFKQYINTPGQKEENWTWLDLWNLLSPNLRHKSFHNSIGLVRIYFQVSLPPWHGKMFRFTNVQITRKCICETFLPSLHNLILDPMQKSPPPILLRGGDTTLIFIFFTISKSFIPNFCGTNYGLWK